ncbi:MAG: hypothetical protein U9Q07_14780 [Planctomycetota bacterium]|nr:hypothetical protein [Planctomycetota bacterium]
MACKHEWGLRPNSKGLLYYGCKKCGIEFDPFEGKPKAPPLYNRTTFKAKKAKCVK